MRRTRAQDNLATLAAPVDTNTGGYYTAGPPATVFSVDDANIIQEELVALATVKGASLDTAGTTRDQCAQAVSGSVKSIDGAFSIFDSGSTSFRRVVVGTGLGYVSCIDGVIVGGYANTLSGGHHSFIGGGYSNYISGTNSTILASEDTAIDRSDKSAIIAGKNNGIGFQVTASACLGTQGSYIQYSKNSAIIGSTDAIMALATASAIVGSAGAYMTEHVNACFVGGGDTNYNYAQSKYSAILGGEVNFITQGTSSAIIAGYQCELSKSFNSAIIAARNSDLGIIITSSFILGGSTQLIESSTKYSGIIGGNGNSITTCENSIIIGAASSEIQGSDYSTILGSYAATITGAFIGAIIGGAGGYISGGVGSVILGGSNSGNQVLASTGSVVVGGDQNGINATWSAIVGGSKNKLSSSESVYIADTYCSSSNPSQTNMTVLSSRYVTLGLGGATGSYQVVGGYNANHSGVAPSWRIASNGGIIHATITTLQGVDYAELFVNFDKKKHPVGHIVTRKGAAAKLASSPTERVLGVVSACPNIVGGADDLTWNGEWLKDKWGAFIMEQVEQIDTHPDGTVTITPVTTRKRNPLYDPTKVHVPRTERPDEWTIVGLLGQLRVAVDATVGEDDYVVSGPNGIGTRSENPGKGRSIECMQIEIPFDPSIGYGVALCIVG